MCYGLLSSNETVTQGQALNVVYLGQVFYFEGQDCINRIKIDQNLVKPVNPVKKYVF